jgi:predicted CXXCH cytochrome family protein
VTGFDETNASWKADGVTCQSCHEDAGGDHPKTTMSIATTNQCGTCHTDTRFGWNDWQGSTHYASGMDCTNCHDPHSTKVKVTGRGATDASPLCMNCHKEIGDDTHGIHAQKGVTCADCHITPMETGLPAHTVPNHSFEATLTQCTSCHKDQIHTSGNALGGGDVNIVFPVHEVTDAPVVAQPTPVSPIGYASLAGLIGLAAGMLLAPWLERWYRLVLHKSNEVQNDEK